MTTLTADSGDADLPDDENLEVLPDDDADVFDTVEGLDAERPVDDSEFDLDGELPPDDV